MLILRIEPWMFGTSVAPAPAWWRRRRGDGHRRQPVHLGNDGFRQDKIRNADGNMVSTWCSANANRERIGDPALQGGLCLGHLRSVIDIQPSEEATNTNGGGVEE